jgi:hypothetical protein
MGTQIGCWGLPLGARLGKLAVCPQPEAAWCQLEVVQAMLGPGLQALGLPPAAAPPATPLHITDLGAFRRTMQRLIWPCPSCL